MTKYILLLIVSVSLLSCTVHEADVHLNLKEEILSDVDFQRLISISNELLSGEIADIRSIKETFLPVVTVLNSKFILDKTELQKELFKEVYSEAVSGSIAARLPVIEFGTSHPVYAPVGDVWFTLEDVQSFPEWNPFTPMVESTFEIGSPIHMTVRFFRHIPDATFSVTETVVDFEVNDRMCWVSVLGSEFWMKSYRCYIVESVTEEETTLRSTMRYEGLLAPLTDAFSRHSVFNGFNDVATAMKERLE
ncbi:MAG: SRPBCC domain-containing protein [Bacteroidetes bacterium]|nr:SRPBCC domain-containing protein [Bacteroidota bacterium]